jgi:L-cysteine S-thiosulfotransferase
MRKLHQIAAACAISAIMLSASTLTQAADAAPKKEMSGKDLAFNKTKGNCLACHAMPTVPDVEAAGLIGPPLIAMSARYPDKAKLRAQIWDATVANPNSSMIPFGKNGVLTEQEIDKVTDFIYGL